jgi:hypothetical protein
MDSLSEVEYPLMLLFSDEGGRRMGMPALLLRAFIVASCVVVLW